MAKKILVIDDDNDMCLLLNRFLTRHGFEVTGMNNGTAAMNWMKQNQPDLVLCDFRLEDMTGMVLLGKIKEMHPAVPVIIITGYSDVKDFLKKVLRPIPWCPTAWIALGVSCGGAETARRRLFSSSSLPRYGSDWFFAASSPISAD